MLIKFQSKATAPFSMLVDTARPLIAGMGQGESLEGSVSGATLRDALAQLLASLKQAEQMSPLQAPASKEEDLDPDAETPIASSVRAVPLLEMMRKALEEDTYVMWQPE